ncbi:uncharacterized protein LOC131029375 [Cryptomeria japonica]|uniref:uncharacterized protein LOC131029375 n=1 Tax=Cryptomeria japonica TaxID=3369 RepID=UPI0025AC682C|nr:uncharacterized protein LOC131029375 [Cryptomeria japonica]
MGEEELKGKALADDDNKEDEENENDEEEMEIPATVSFPRSSQRQPPLPPLKVEVEDKGGSGSQHMWQVYALGGFLIVRWLWARWQERRARGRNEGDDNNNLDGSANHRPDF